jgi:hypothetical protein
MHISYLVAIIQTIMIAPKSKKLIYIFDEMASFLISLRPALARGSPALARGAPALAGRALAMSVARASFPLPLAPLP